MTELTLTRDERLALKSQSHHLDPIVLLGANGLTAAVLKEIDRALTAHQLVKVRTPAGERQEREQLFLEVAERLGAARIQMIGRLIVLFRPALSPDPSPASGRGEPLAPSRPRTGRGEPLAAPRPRSGRGEPLPTPRPRTGKGEPLALPRPRSGRGEPLASSRPRSGKGEPLASPRPRSGRHEPFASSRPRSGRGEPLASSRPRASRKPRP
ncbi:MAG TPA: YhbY family RNA-binding protein [Burkholderiaceae bacterium]|nr:YhbY family RNA-binding protein [Burkholderiaceae bacterium]